MQYRGEQRSVDLNMPIVIDEAEFAELVHEKADAGSGSADHIRQRFLTDVRTDPLRNAFLSEIRQQQQHARKPPLARIEKLVDQIALDPNITGQEICHEEFGKRRLIVK